MTGFDQLSVPGFTALPAAHGQHGARQGSWSLLWLGLALVAAALLLVALGDGVPRVAGPPPVTVGTAAYHGDAA